MRYILSTPILKKEVTVVCGAKTCKSREGNCEYLGRWVFNKSYESPFCCELFKIKSIMPFPLTCRGNKPYRICGIFEKKRLPEKDRL